MTPRMRVKHRLKSLIDEVTTLRAKVVEYDLYLDIKDKAMQDYVNERISEWNAAIRKTNGPKRGESMESYKQRLLDANKEENAWGKK